MYSLEGRYMRGDMIEVYKMFNGLDDVKFLYSDHIFSIEIQKTIKINLIATSTIGSSLIKVCLTFSLLV